MNIMDRKLIKLANKTLVVSLPYGWINLLKLKKGDTVELSENDKEIIIQPKDKKNEKEFVLDVRDLPDNFVKRALAATYKAGFTNIKLICSKTQADLIENRLDNFTGMVIIEKTDNYIMLRNLVEINSKDFEPIFKKTFFILTYISGELSEIIKKDNKKKIDEILSQKNNLKKHINLCIYLLNKSGYKSLKETNNYFYVLSTFEAIGDIYFRICSYLKTGKKLSKNTIYLYSLVDLFLNETYKYYFAKNNIKNIYIIRDKISMAKSLKFNEVPAGHLIFAAKLIREIIECKYMIDIIRKER